MAWVRRNMTAGYLVGKPEEEGPLTRLKCGWEDNIKISPKEMRWEGLDWICLSLDRDNWRAVVNAVVNFRVT
jgi:hypothetical protein